MPYTGTRLSLANENGDSSAYLACIVYNKEVNSRDDNKQLAMKKNHGRCHDNGFGNILHIFYP